MQQSITATYIAAIPATAANGPRTLGVWKSHKLVYNHSLVPHRLGWNHVESESETQRRPSCSGPWNLPVAKGKYSRLRPSPSDLGAPPRKTSPGSRVGGPTAVAKPGHPMAVPKQSRRRGGPTTDGPSSSSSDPDRTQRHRVAGSHHRTSAKSNFSFAS